MLELIYSPAFVRQVKNLEADLQEEVIEKIKLFKNKENHPLLKIHKLHGRLSGRRSFSVNYKIRIIFTYQGKNEAVLHSVGDHDIYR